MDTVSIAQFIRAIDRLPADPPQPRPGIWYTTQKQHWLGWLGQYNTPGAYGRRPGQNRDAKYAYNHIVCPEMLLWLIRAAGVREDLVAATRAAYDAATNMMQQSGAIRRIVPWAVVYEALFTRGWR